MFIMVLFQSTLWLLRSESQVLFRLSNLHCIMCFACWYFFIVSLIGTSSGMLFHSIVVVSIFSSRFVEGKMQFLLLSSLACLARVSASSLPSIPEWDLILMSVRLIFCVSIIWRIWFSVILFLRCFCFLLLLDCIALIPSIAAWLSQKIVVFASFGIVVSAERIAMSSAHVEDGK